MNQRDPTDDRITCLWCQHSAGFRCRLLNIGTLVTLARRCKHYLPNPDEADQRTGMQRWPGLETSITLARAEDAAHRKENG